MNILLVTFGILGIVYCRRHHKHKKHKTDVDYDMCVPKGDYATKADLKKIVRDLLEIKVLENQIELKGPKGRNGVRGAKGESGNCCKYDSPCLRRTRDSILKGKTKSYKFMKWDKVYWHDAYLQCLQNNMTLPEPRNSVDYAEMKKFSIATGYDEWGAWTGITTFENGIFFNRVSDGEPLTYADWNTGYPNLHSPALSVTYSTCTYDLYHDIPRTYRAFFCEQWS